MTKYILHGGYSRVINADNDAFFQEMTTDYPNGKVKILLCYFARSEDDIEKYANQDKEQFIKNSTNKNLDFEIADKNNLAEQLKKAHVFYMRGGEPEWLINKLKLTSNLEQLFSGKTIAGSSAGAYSLCKYYQGSKLDYFGEGLGILNLKVYCHYKNENKETLKKLINQNEKLPVIILPDYKWQVIYQ